ncbi:sulfotransferase domain-containing protein [Cohnella lubricantis]|uniref:Sulfotransferase domain-containing protein n=1 Tax=Cohnella lubricantis TaxID=2163172 RepID=A0A841TA46_9BACL|nr:sulfotransferase domain-containing protein [Cohnella lubricantis]MBB6675907.1 sulfotransferase domain-containing protein [Cohnella lubricantis]MBP2117176.1 hypothetical protein [Cohnella lubricantis]
MYPQGPISLPPFISSSVPKSGTHLMHQMLNGIPGVTNDINDASKKFFANNPPAGFYDDHSRRLALLQPNQFAIGHLYYEDRYARMLEQYKLKHIFLYRDPRDVFVSLIYYIADNWIAHPLHPYFRTRYFTFEDRAAALLQGIPEYSLTFGQYITLFYGWIREPNCLKVSFEQLMVTPERRRETVLRILHYLWEGRMLPMPMQTMAFSMESRINSTTSRTFRKGLIGSWRTEFSGRIKQLFKQNAGQLVIDTGYEKTMNW